MLRKFMIVFILLVATGCSVLPFEISIQNKDSAAQQPTVIDFVSVGSNSLLTNQEKTISTCPAACPQPVCPQPIWPTCAPCNSSGSGSTATAAPSATAVPSATATGKPSATPTKTAVPPTATSTAKPTLTNTPSRTPTATAVNRPYEIQANTPLYNQNFAHTDKGCNWMGIAGQVFDRSGNPVPNLVLVAEGSYNGKTIDVLGLTGLNSVYGPGGYELVIGDKAVASSGTVSLILFDLNGNELSTPLKITTYADCAKNLVVVNFKQK